MKYLLVIALCFGVVWLWRHNRQAHKSESLRKNASGAARLPAVEIVACDVCGVHLPKTEALVGRNGAAYYCSDAHRREAER